MRNKEHFYSVLAQKVIATTFSKWEMANESAKCFFFASCSRNFNQYSPTSEISIDSDWVEVNCKTDEVLDLTDEIAMDKTENSYLCK